MSDTSSPDDRSQEGGVRLCSPPRRARPTAAAPVTGASKGSSHKKPEVQDPDSPTPAPKNKRNDDRSNDMNAFHYQMAQGSFPNAHYPTMTTPSFGGASETSSALSYYPPGHRGYAKHIAPSGARHAMLHSAESGSSTASSSVMEGLTANMLGMELKFHDYYTGVNGAIRQIQGQMYKISQNTFRHEGLPPDFAQDIDGALKDVGRDLGRLAGLVEKVSMECAKMEAERQQIQATAGVQAVEIERLRAQLEALRMGLSAAEKHNDEVQSTYQSILLTKEEQNKRNHEQLQTCKQQLDGKRHLFYTTSGDIETKAKILEMFSDNEYREKARIIQALLDSNPHDKSKILDILMGNNTQGQSRSVSYQPSSMTNFPRVSGTPGSDMSFSSQRPSRTTPPAPTIPGTRYTPSAFHGGSIVRSASVMPGSSHSRYNSNPRSRPSTGPRGNQASGVVARYRFDDHSPFMRPPQELGSPQPSRARQAIVAQAYDEWDAAVMTWSKEFRAVFHMVHGWVSQYAMHVQEGQADVIAKDAPRLWEYLSDILYSNQPDAGASHAAYLLEDEKCRGYFVTRVMLQYIVANIFSVEAWMEFSPETDRELKELNARLHSTEFSKAYLRQSLVDKISSIVGTILMDDGFGEYRQRRITFHQQRLKTIVGPLVDLSCSRSDAAFDLHNVASAALQVSAMMFQSRLHFEFQWSDTCTKFNFEIHNPVDISLDPMMLQQKQYRIKLVVTPTIFFRDDRGLGTNPKRVSRAEVFVMN